MLTLLSEVKFLTTRDDVDVKSTDFGAFRYADKKSLTKTDLPYVDAKQEYARLRSQEYILHGRKSKHVKYAIKKLEEMLKHNRIVYCSWRDNVLIQMLLSNGALVHMCIDIFTGDIIRIAFDKFLIGKLISEDVADVIMTRMHILISYDGNQITFVHLQKPNLKKSVPTKIRKLDPKIFNIIISGSHTRKIARHLTCNNCYDLLAIWTKSSQNEVYPWRPTFRDQDRANIHIYRLSRNKIDLLCYYWTENDPINVEFSKLNQNQLRSIEQKISRKGEVTIEICVYEVNKAKIHRTSVTSIPLHSQVCSHSFSPDNEKLMLGCIDGSVVLFDEGRGITHLIKAAFIPTLVSWHADSAIVMIANEKSQVQCFDISLSCMRHQILSEDMMPDNVLELSNFFATQPSLLQICCSEKPDLAQYNEKYMQSDSFVLLLFETGPMAILRLFGGNGHKGDVHTSGFTADVLIQQYLKLNSVEKAINILLCLNWDVYGAMLMISLHKVASYIFKQPFQSEREIQLQKALGSFLVPVKPLCEETQSEFGDQVRDLTRKFFQYLLRYKSYEKAFTLAIDINDEDLFMDLTNCAKDDGFLELAQDAYQKAEQILARSASTQSTDSICSHESCSECSTNSIGEDSEIERSSPEIDLKKNRNSTEKHFQSTNVLGRHRKTNMDQSIKRNDPFDRSNFNPTLDAQRSMLKKELKVSHYSKNIPDNLTDQLKPTEFSKLNENPNYKLTKTTCANNPFKNDFPDRNLKFESKAVEIELTSDVTRISRHRVVDVVPRPNLRQFSLDYKVPDQTIGIPITNILPSRDIQNTSYRSVHQQQSKPCNPSYLTAQSKPWGIHNVSNNVPQVIHHPLISGNIPPFFHSMSENHMIKKINNEGLSPAKTNSRQIVNASMSNMNVPQNSLMKRENGEKNKVKFSNTVTIAVVPDIARKEKSLFDHTKRSNSNDIQLARSFDTKRELKDSLPLCHPNDDYLKDFAPMKFQGKSNDRKPTLEEGVLTWV